MTDQQLIDQINQAIEEYLNTCDDGKTPAICKLISTEGGFEKIKGEVFDLIKEEGKSIAEAVMDLEGTYNPNKVED